MTKPLASSVGGLNVVLRQLGWTPLTIHPTWRGMARAAAWLTLCWLLLGLHCYLLVLGYGANSWRALPLALVSRSGLLLVEESSLLHGGAQVGGLAAKEPVGRRTDSE